MPIYEYECKRCGYRFEFFKRNNEKEPSKCPKCKSSIRKLFSQSVGFIFKGSGFYATDYKNNEEKKSKSSCSTCSREKCSTCK